MTKEQAEKEWGEFDDKLDSIEPPNAVSLASWKSREAYKSALRAEIEKREPKNKNLTRKWTKQELLELLDIVTPEGDKV